MPKTVYAAWWSTWQMVNPFSSTKKFTVTCGDCRYTFVCRVPVMNYPRTICPACNTVNIIQVVIGQG